MLNKFNETTPTKHEMESEKWEMSNEMNYDMLCERTEKAEKVHEISCIYI